MLKELRTDMYRILLLLSVEVFRLSRSICGVIYIKLINGTVRVYSCCVFVLFRHVVKIEMSKC